MKSFCGSADLIRLLEVAGDQEFDRLARVFGYLPTDEPVAVTLQGRATLPPFTTKATVSSEPRIVAQPLLETPFWYLAQFETVGDDIVRRIALADEGPTELPEWSTDPGQQPEPLELAAWRDLLPRLRGGLALPTETRMPDVREIVRRLGRGYACVRLPRRKRRQWGQSLWVVEDRSDRLIPYWQDQERVTVCLAALFPRHAFRHGLIWETLDIPVPADPEAPHEGFWPPPTGTPVVVLSDLGGLALGDDRVSERWARLGAQLREIGCRGLALLPEAAESCTPAVRAVWEFLTWEHDPGLRGPASLRSGAEQLLAALSLASRIEPGLLREVRRLLGLPAAVESVAWMHPALTSRSSIAATLGADAAQALRDRFRALDPAVQGGILDRMHAWRGGLPHEIWFAEIQSLVPELRALLPHAEDVSASDAFFAALGRRLHGIGGPKAPAGMLAWYRFVAPRLRQGHETDSVLGVHFQRLYKAAFAESRRAPELRGYDPALAADSTFDVQPTRYRLAQHGGQLFATPREPASAESGMGSTLGIVATVSRELKIEPLDPFWVSGTPPTWADAWGWDEYGAWVEFSVEGKGGRVTQRMRWIEPGSLLMGSPENEPERGLNEGPQHEVTFKEGFWLFDTACTQALWQAVMGENPSRFLGADRPVEQVSWDEAQVFIPALNSRLPGLELSLPSEAQWEYACRAGTTTPFSFGQNITPEQVNYNGFYPYPGGEKGLYRKETVPAGSLPANPWGLYEMHGNVMEWVQDGWHDNYEGAPSDGRVWEASEPGAGRVMRGGAWGSLAMRCRSASRYWHGHGRRYDYLGFRCARVQGREPGGPEGIAERENVPRPGPRSGKGRVAEGTVRGASSWQGAVASVGRVSRYSGVTHRPVEMAEQGPEGKVPTLLRLDSAALASVPLPQAAAFRLLTDRERLTFRRMTKPEWARAMGRDRYGLWAEIAISHRGYGHTVIQSLRWIPPGRFLMGSPDNEPERGERDGPRHEVTITKGFWLTDTACTQALWNAVLWQNPSEFGGDDRWPVERVSWHDVQRFLRGLESLLFDCRADLPTEAEWEFACRAGSDTPFNFGEQITPEQVNYDGNYPYVGGANGLHRKMTVPVKSLPPNAWGLYEMHGNVWEWCADGPRVYDDHPRQDPRGLVMKGKKSNRAVRGGSWHVHAGRTRSASRNAFRPKFSNSHLGFRFCLRSIEASQEPGRTAESVDTRMSYSGPMYSSFAHRGAPPEQVKVEITFAVHITAATIGKVYVVGNIAELGSWDANRAKPLSEGPSGIWSTRLRLPEKVQVEYKYIQKNDAIVWEGGSNHYLKTPPSGGDMLRKDEWNR